MDNFWQVKKPLPNTLNQQVIDTFLIHLKLANRNQGTIIHYREFLTLFFSYTSESFAALTSDDILNWFRKNQEHIKETTYRFRLRVLSSFYTFCVKEAYVKHSPIKSGGLFRLPQPLPNYFERESIAQTRNLKKLIALRNQVLVEFMRTSGCKAEEVNRLNRRNVDIPNRTVRVVGPGRKIRHVHFSDKYAFLMERYMGGRMYQSHALFTSYTGKRLSVSRIQKIVRTWGEEKGLIKGWQMHPISHTFTTEVAARGIESSFFSE
jgi:site-specific recombinase XerD